MLCTLIDLRLASASTFHFLCMGFLVGEGEEGIVMFRVYKHCYCNANMPTIIYWKRPLCQGTNRSLVGTLITKGDITRNIAIRLGSPIIKYSNPLRSCYSTRRNFSCNMQRNVDDSKSLQDANHCKMLWGVRRSQLSLQLAMRLNFSPRKATIFLSNMDIC